MLRGGFGIGFDRLYNNVYENIRFNAPFRDHYEFTVQAAFFDLDNHPEFANPVANTIEGNFGQSTSANSRVGQLSGRFDF